MKKLIIVLGMYAFSMAAHADGVIGSWDFAPQDAGQLTVFATVVVAQDKISATAKCAYKDGVTSVAKLEAKANVTPTVIAILESQSASSSEPNHECQVSVQPIEIPYTLTSDDKLELSIQGQTITLTRTPKMHILF